MFGREQTRIVTTVTDTGDHQDFPTIVGSSRIEVSATDPYVRFHLPLRLCIELGHCNAEGNA